MSVRVHPDWDTTQYREMSAAIEQARRDDPEYDNAWRDGLQRMADDWDAVVAERVYAELTRDHFYRLLNMQRTGDDPV